MYTPLPSCPSGSPVMPRGSPIVAWCPASSSLWFWKMSNGRWICQDGVFCRRTNND